MNFNGKTAIVTGAASGMGLLFSQNFARLGGNVVMSDINKGTLDQKADEINAEGEGKAIAAVCDVRDYNQVCRVRDTTVCTFGSIDVMVNFAGGAELRMLNAGGTEFPDTPIEVFDWGIDVNLKGQFYFDHAVLKQMREQKSGVIINIGSITGEEGSKSNVAYSTSKSGVMHGLTKSVAMYGSKYGIRCVCVSPGPVLTRPGMASMKTALGYAAEPQEIIDMILYLISDSARSITGVNFLLDGGRNFLTNKE
ncbi:MAG: SDR family oxidoreductase [Clostridia bacterium]|nr:SDR family oxidoreductase [Clostridia bacterium]